MIQLKDFQFSFWDSSISWPHQHAYHRLCLSILFLRFVPRPTMVLRASVRSLSILFLRFPSFRTWPSEDQSVLSILFLRFGLHPRHNSAADCGVVFQFSFWDSERISDPTSGGDFYFQFSFWDSAPPAARWPCCWDLTCFQFSFWDSFVYVVCAHSQALFSAFNSLFEILIFHAIAIRNPINLLHFQFSFWDSTFKGVMCEWLRWRSFNSLFEIPGVDACPLLPCLRSCPFNSLFEIR